MVVLVLIWAMVAVALMVADEVLVMAIVLAALMVAVMDHS